MVHHFHFNFLTRRAWCGGGAWNERSCLIFSIVIIITASNPGEMLYISVPKLNENKVLVPGFLTLCFDIDLAAGHVNKLVVKFAGTVPQEMAGYDIYKTFRTFSFQRKRKTAWGLREYRVKAYARSALAQITRKPWASLLAESKLNKVCCMDRVLHQVRLWDPGWPRCFPSPGPLQWPHIRNNPRTSFTSCQRLLPNKAEIQEDQHSARVRNSPQQDTGRRGAQRLLQWQRVCLWPDEALCKVATFMKDTNMRLNIKVHAQRRSMKAILILFVEPYCQRARDSEKIHLPWSNESQRYDQRLAQHGLQEWDRKHGHVEGDQPLPRERKNE